MKLFGILLLVLFLLLWLREVIQAGELIAVLKQLIGIAIIWATAALIIVAVEYMFHF